MHNVPWSNPDVEEVVEGGWQEQHQQGHAEAREGDVIIGEDQMKRLELAAEKLLFSEVRERSKKAEITGGAENKSFAFYDAGLKSQSKVSR